MPGGMNVSANSMFTNSSGAMSRARSSSGGGEADFKALSKKDSAFGASMVKDELQYEYLGDFEQQMKDWKDDDWN